MEQEFKISVVVCTYNRAKFIPACLESLEAQTLLPHYWEAVVVDNASTDATADKVQDFLAAKPSINLRYVFEGNKGLSYARNRGIAEARSNLICFIDDDAEAVPGFVQSIVEFMEQKPMASGVGGMVIPKYTEVPEPAWMNKYLNGFIGKVDHGRQVRLFGGRMKYPIGCNMTYRKAILREAGGFNNQLTFRADDKQIYYAVAAINPNVYYLPEAKVYHNIDGHRLTLENFRKLFLKTGNEERLRVKSQNGHAAILLKAMEYVAKLAVAVLIYLRFVVMRQESKGRYVLYSQYYTLRGFLTKKVFVR